MPCCPLCDSGDLRDVPGDEFIHCNGCGENLDLEDLREVQETIQ